MTGLPGTVIERDGAAYRVMTGHGEVRAVLSGKTKRDTPRVVVGDRVTRPAGCRAWSSRSAPRGLRRDDQARHPAGRGRRSGDPALRPRRRTLFDQRRRGAQDPPRAARSPGPWHAAHRGQHRHRVRRHLQL